MNQRIEMLRKIMEKNQIDYYIIPTDDYHGSEYVGEYFKVRQFVTGFTGSAGTAVIWKDGAGLWTDGRYFLQASQELEGSGVTLYRMGEKGVPTIEEFLEEQLQSGQCAAADGRTISQSYAVQLKKAAEKKQAYFISCRDLTEEIWKDRPALSCSEIWLLEEQYAGQSRNEKLKIIHDLMQKKDADYLVLSALDEIAWLFNMRGGDVACCPLVLSYAVIGREETLLYIQDEACTPIFLEEMKNCEVTLKTYDAVYHELSEIVERKKVWIDKAHTNMALFELVEKAHCLIQEESPIQLLKAVKNKQELDGFRKAHLYDGIAVTRFMFWLKTHVEKENITEISAAEKLEEFRKENSHYLMPSFEPIMGYQEHGAIVHYSADQDSNKMIKAEGILLSDTGGHYREGTTDITRAFVLGELTKQQKEHYTRVLKGNLRLMTARFPKGCSGENLDAIARMPLWEAGLDYNHGTGHGIGHIMNVHEGPQAIRWRYKKGHDPITLTSGMILSNEPGLYLEGQYGIRLENMMICQEDLHNEFGEFLCFEVLTLVPFEREAILPELLDDKEKQTLNLYHKKIRETLLPFMENQEERVWLMNATEKIGLTK